jgi:hypothetical protein
VLVGKDHGIGKKLAMTADRVVHYNGEAVSLSFKSRQ